MSTTGSKGIYRFSLQPTHAGKGKLIYDIKEGDNTSRIVVDNIEVFTDQNEANTYAHNSMITNSNAASFTKEQSWKISFATE